MPDPTDALPTGTPGLSGGAPDAAGGAGQPPMPGGAPPSGAPMLTPQKAAGKQASGKVKVQIAIHALQLAMLDVGAASPEGQAILDAIRALVKKFGKSEEDSKALMPAEIAQILQQQKKPAPGAAAGAPPGGAGAAPPMPAAA